MSRFTKYVEHNKYSVADDIVSLIRYKVDGNDVAFTAPVANLYSYWKKVPMDKNAALFKNAELHAAACRYVNAFVNTARAETLIIKASAQADRARQIIDDPASVGEKLERAKERYERAMTVIASVLYAVNNGEHAAEYIYTPDTPYSEHDRFLLECMGAFANKAPSSLDVSTLYNVFVVHGKGSKHPSKDAERKNALNGFLRAVELMDGANGESTVFNPLKTLVNAQDIALFESVRAHGLRQNTTTGAVYVPITDENTFSQFVPQWFLYFLQSDVVRKGAPKPDARANVMQSVPAEIIGSFVPRTTEIKKTVRRVDANGDEITVTKTVKA